MLPYKYTVCLDRNGVQRKLCTAYSAPYLRFFDVTFEVRSETKQTHEMGDESKTCGRPVFSGKAHKSCVDMTHTTKNAIHTITKVTTFG
jgi:hypothetical protein